MTGARDAVLASVRAALANSPSVPSVPRGYTPAGARTANVDLFCDRLADYQAGVHLVTAAQVDRALGNMRRGSVVVPPGFDWSIGGAQPLVDEPPLSLPQLDAAGTVATGCALAIAETGTIILDGSPVCGRRALTLVPDHHVCVVRRSQLVAAVPDAIAAVRRDRPLTFISGPSATSDIELERVEGVHGPRALDVVVVTDA
jgi:L-lactate dehydrogenase complex protein LldG